LSCWTLACTTVGRPNIVCVLHSYNISHLHNAPVEHLDDQNSVRIVRVFVGLGDVKHERACRARSVTARLLLRSLVPSSFHILQDLRCSAASLEKVSACRSLARLLKISRKLEDPASASPAQMSLQHDEGTTTELQWDSLGPDCSLTMTACLIATMESSPESRCLNRKL